MKHELQRRQSLEDRLLAFIVSHPRRWLAWYELAEHGGQAWRSRLPQIRQRLAARGYVVEWNKQNGNDSAYMLRERPLARSADQVIEQVGLFS